LRITGYATACGDWMCCDRVTLRKGRVYTGNGGGVTRNRKTENL